MSNVVPASDPLTSTEVTMIGNLQSLTPLGTGFAIAKIDANTFANVPLVSGGTVTSISVATANGVSGSVATATTTPVITLTLGAITPTSVAIGGATLGSNGLAVTGHLLLEGVTSTGATGTGLLVFGTSPTLTTAVLGSSTATTQASTDNSTKVATTAYVTTGISNAIAGVNPAVAVQAATTAASDTSGLTYSNGVAGIGATLTGTNNVAFAVDGFTFTAINQRVLVKNDTQSPSGAFNGVYYVTQIQTAILPPILTRALDYDMPSDINNTGAIPVVNGTLNALTSWLLTSTITTVGTDPLTYSKFSINPSSQVTAVSIATANGFSGSSSGGTTPALTIVAGAIVPTSVNGLIITTTAGTLTVANSASASLITSGNFALTLTATATTNSTFPSGTDTLSGLGTSQTYTGIKTFSPTARSSGTAAYFTINIPADTAQTASTESIGFKTVTATRTWATTGTVALQRENYFAGVTYASASASQTFTDITTLYVDKPLVGSNAVFTRAHSVVIVDSTSAASSITGGLIIATTLGTTATSVGIGGGNINAGGTLIVGGHVTVEGVTSTGATGTGKFVFDTSPDFTTAVTLGGVAIPTISSTNTFTNKFITPQLQSVADAAGTFTPVSITNDMGVMTALSQATTIAAPTGSPVQGERLLLRLKDNGTARALTWNTIYRASSDLALPTTTILSKTLYCGFIYNSTDTKWDLVALLNNF